MKNKKEEKTPFSKGFFSSFKLFFFQKNGHLSVIYPDLMAIFLSF